MHLLALSHTGHCQAAQTCGAALEGFGDQKAAHEIAAVRATLSCRPSG